MQGDGGYYKLLGFLSVPTGFKKLEAPTQTSRHLQTSASPDRICTAEPLLLLNATIHSKHRENKNKNATSQFVSVFLSFLLPFRGTLRKKAAVCLESAICFHFVVQFVQARVVFFRLFFVFFPQTLNSSVWNKTVDIHLLQRTRLVIHKLAVRPAQTHKRPICGAIITSTTTSPDKTIRPSVL